MRSLRQLSNWVAAEVAPPLIAALLGMIEAIVVTKQQSAPLVYQYTFFKHPLPYCVLMLAGAACLGIGVVFLFGRLFFSIQALKGDEEGEPWWAGSKRVIPIVLAGTLSVVLAQAFV